MYRTNPRITKIAISSSGFAFVIRSTLEQEQKTLNDFFNFSPRLGYTNTRIRLKNWAHKHYFFFQSQLDETERFSCHSIDLSFHAHHVSDTLPCTDKFR